MNIKTLSDIELISEYKKTANQAYLAELILRYSKQITTICLSLIKDNNLREDALLDINLKIVQELTSKEFENSQHFKNWLAMITKNNCISLLRRKKTEHKFINYNKDIDDLKNNVEIQKVERNNSVSPKELKNALNTLTEGQRRCIELFFFKGYKITDNVLKKLTTAGLSENISKKLTVMKDMEFRGEGFFHDYIKSINNEKIEGNNLALITEHALFSDRKSYNEIGEITGFTFKKIKSHIQTGKIKLRNKLRKKLDDDGGKDG